MHLGEGLLADVAIALLVEAGPLIEVFRLRRLEPQRGEHSAAALNPQARLLDGLAVMLLRGFAFGAAEGLRHLDEIVALGLCDETGEREQLTPLLLREAREVRAIGFDRSQHPDASAQIVIGNVHAGIVWGPRDEGLPARGSRSRKTRRRAACSANVSPRPPELP